MSTVPETLEAGDGSADTHQCMTDDCKCNNSPDNINLHLWKPGPQTVATTMSMTCRSSVLS